MRGISDSMPYSLNDPFEKTQKRTTGVPGTFQAGNPPLSPPKRQFLKEWIGAGIRPPRVTNASQLVWFTGMIGA